MYKTTSSLQQAPAGCFNFLAIPFSCPSIFIDYFIIEMKQNQNTRLIGQKVILVPYEHSHVAKYHSWMEDPELRQQTASEPLSMEAEYEMQRKWREDEDKCTFIVLSKECVDQGQSEIDCMIGDVNLFLNRNEFDDHSQPIAELEIMIAERAWRGRGLGREAVVLMLLYAIDHIRLRKFQVKIGSGNVTSLKLFESLGFHRVSYSEVFDEITLACAYASDDDTSENAAFLSGLRNRYKFIVDVYQKE